MADNIRVIVDKAKVTTLFDTIRTKANVTGSKTFDEMNEVVESITGGSSEDLNEVITEQEQLINELTEALEDKAQPIATGKPIDVKSLDEIPLTRENSDKIYKCGNTLWKFNMQCNCRFIQVPANWSVPAGYGNIEFYYRVHMLDALDYPDEYVNNAYAPNTTLPGNWKGYIYLGYENESTPKENSIYIVYENGTNYTITSNESFAIYMYTLEYIDNVDVFEWFIDNNATFNNIYDDDTTLHVTNPPEYHLQRLGLLCSGAMTEIPCEPGDYDVRGYEVARVSLQ